MEVLFRNGEMFRQLQNGETLVVDARSQLYAPKINGVIRIRFAEEPRRAVVIAVNVMDTGRTLAGAVGAVPPFHNFDVKMYEAAQHPPLTTIMTQPYTIRDTLTLWRRPGGDGNMSRRVGPLLNRATWKAALKKHRLLPLRTPFDMSGHSELGLVGYKATCCMIPQDVQCLLEVTLYREG
ncbi:unnamed protein product [Vitrella brassicaformis CCMP3155]|uniref:Uncharacterized protein n=2 Tax=Vitrella brassicaformis TaxID=1169539 RepID=A0A0G4F6Q1_VITBC|nr:unnamed protein product [Vitrella brassicaformis CCMP3155]|eukprot:CEM07929.1 unnamed protein product [Vitrella brassicaformis CCMP3155]